jgi:tRNA threonylcarbamoyladenosine biosynthesis protein TsaE
MMVLKSMRTVTTHSERETMDLAARIARLLAPGDLITLDGPLGSGKTCFVRGLARGLGIDPTQVSSPTFVIRQEYADEIGNGSTLTHIDGYRVSGPDELETIGWEELLDARESIVAVEWPSRLGDAAAGRAKLAVSFAHRSPTERELAFEADDAFIRKLEALIADVKTE